MPKETSGTHTTESVEHVANRLEKLAAQIRASRVLMELPQPLGPIEVLKERSLKDGLAGIQIWANALQDAVHDAQLASLRDGRAVSDTAGKVDKQRKKAI